jgi:hypothetical protein
MFELFTILRIIFSILFTLLCLYFTQFITAVGEKKCPLSKSLYISNGNLLSSLLMIIAVINIFIPINKFLATIPILGSSYILIFILVLFTTFFILKRIVSNLDEDENTQCKSKLYKSYKSLIDFINNRSITECIYATFILSILFFYL